MVAIHYGADLKKFLIMDEDELNLKACPVCNKTFIVGDKVLCCEICRSIIHRGCMPIGVNHVKREKICSHYQEYQYLQCEIRGK